jgi:hypothetical protein
LVEVTSENYLFFILENGREDFPRRPAREAFWEENYHVSTLLTFIKSLAHNEEHQFYPLYYTDRIDQLSSNWLYIDLNIILFIRY